MSSGRTKDRFGSHERVVRLQLWMLSGSKAGKLILDLCSGCSQALTLVRDPESMLPISPDTSASEAQTGRGRGSARKIEQDLACLGFT